MKFSYSAVWDDTVALIRSHGSLVAALAGVFIFLPSLLLAYLVPQPVPAEPSQFFVLMMEYMRANWIWILLENLLNTAGVIAILRLALPNGPSTVGGVIASAFTLLPFYFLATILSTTIIFIGLLLLFVPGLYLLGRLAPLGPVMAAEDRRNPIDALRRAFEVTKGRGWAVFGIVAIVVVAGMIVSMVINSVFGLMFVVAAGPDTGLFLTLIVGSATGAAFAALLALLYAAIYRNLAGGSSVDVFK